jgi:monoamine oxidase
MVLEARDRVGGRTVNTRSKVHPRAEVKMEARHDQNHPREVGRRYCVRDTQDAGARFSPPDRDRLPRIIEHPTQPEFQWRRGSALTVVDVQDIS